MSKLSLSGRSCLACFAVNMPHLQTPFELGSQICGLATSSSKFISGRGIAGLGAAGNFNGALSIMSSSVPLNTSPLHNGMMAGFARSVDRWVAD